ncbi:MAG: hypothetical protein ACT4OS_02705 [Acidimicrobiales bacterium]
MTTASGNRPTHRWSRWMAALGLIAGLGAACGDDDPQVVVEQLANLGSFCELTRSLTAALPEGANLDSGSVAAAVAALGPAFDQLPRLAPDEIKEPTETIVTALRAAAGGDLAATAAPEYQQARQRLVDFQDAECPVGSSSGEL